MSINGHAPHQQFASERDEGDRMTNREHIALQFATALVQGAAVRGDLTDCEMEMPIAFRLADAFLEASE